LNDKMIGEILKEYPIRVSSTVFIRHNENLTYKVTDEANGMSYLLRIHKAVTPNLSGLQHTYEGLKAEMTLLQELNEKTDVLVQTPVRNTAGEWVTRVTAEGEVVQCTLLQWIEGRDIQQDETISKEHIIHFGEQVGNLHQFSRTTGMRMSEVRPAYAGIAQNESKLKRLELGVSLGVFSGDDFITLKKIFEVLNSSLETYPQTVNTWGIIHADINKGNLLVTQHGIAIIDFCLFGYGYYLYDVAGSVLSFKPEERDHFISGYTSKSASFSEKDMKLLEGFMILSILGFYAFHMENEDKHTWMRERMPIFCNKYCQPIINNQSIFYKF
jgi:Ser/Thr protein kinase RdoA (MazF antagonist)